MAQRGGTDDWLLTLLCTLPRRLLSHHGNLLLALTFVGVIVIWINMNFSHSILDSSEDLSFGGSIHPYMLANRKQDPPSPAELERRRRVAEFSRIFQKQVRKRRRNQNISVCIHPKMDLKHDANQFAYFDMPPLNCSGSGMVYSLEGVLVLNTSVISSELLGKCSFYSLTRETDNGYSYAAPTIRDSPPFDIYFPHDFVRIRCVLASTLQELKAADKDDSQRESMEYDKEERGDGNETAGNGIGKTVGGNEEINGNEIVGDRNEKADKGNDKAYDRNEKVDEQGKEDSGGSMEEEDQDGDEASLDVNLVHDAAEVLDKDETNFYEQNNDELDYDSIWQSHLYETLYIPDFEPSDFDQFLVQVHPRPEVFQRISKVEASLKKNTMRLNVLMFALDSMSHLCYQRKLPLTYKYLKDELGAVILENYNIVGDATTAAIIPMLTGLSEMDLPEVRQSKLEAKSVDSYPLVWKAFQEHGYATLFAEDEPSISTFNLRLNGFREQPTDHYMRPFWQALWESNPRQSSDRFCTGDIAHHRFMLKYLEDFFIQYRNVSKFAFGFHVELTHSDNNPAQYIDADLTAFLQRLKRGKLLEDTVVIMFGDHGARYSKVRQTVQGKLEERLPMMSFTFPQKFRQRYPQLYENLATNVDRLTSPYDIHETLLDILYQSDTRTRSLHQSESSDEVVAPQGISLLREIPADRTCHDAGIGTHWCTCLQQIMVETTGEYVQRSANSLLQHLNSLTELHRKQCAPLKLTRVLNAQLVLPNERVLKFRRTNDDQRVANFSHEIDLDVVHYQLQVETEPCGALYEATVTANFRNYTDYKFTVTPDISRINKYGSQPLCIQDTYPMLRKFCCCHDYLRKNHRRNTRKKNDTKRRKGPH